MRKVTDIYKPIEKTAKAASKAVRRLSKYHIGQATVIFIVVVGLVFGNWLGFLEFSPRVEEARAAESMVTVDSEGNPAYGTSIALDSNGYPVIAHWAASPADLMIVHCNDANCAGGNESMIAVDFVDYTGRYPSFVLDSNGYPVIAYENGTDDDLIVVHCNDVNCAGGNESIRVVDSAVSHSVRPSIVLDSNGYPVIAYSNVPTGTSLKVVHCGNANCSSGNSKVIVDTSASTYPSLVLDANGFPVIAYQSTGDLDLKVIHCGNANCSSGNSTVTVDATGDTGRDPSLKLDSNGYPVVSYQDNTNDTLKILHCNDVNCAGGDESIEIVDSIGSTDQGTSLALDANGYPVVSYYASGLKILHCNDVNCAGGNESIVTVDGGGQFSSLVLDANGHPVISHKYSGLRVVHCDDPNCDPNVVGLPPTVTTNVATNVAALTATLNGTANPNGNATTGWFRYSTTDPGTCNDTFGTRAPLTGGSSLGPGTSTVAYSENITGLSPSTAYYFCAIANNSSGTGFGTILTFTTIDTTLTQSAYRFFANNNSTDIGFTLGAQDTAVILGSTGAEFRLRALIHITGSPLN